MTALTTDKWELLCDDKFELHEKSVGNSLERTDVNTVVGRAQVDGCTRAPGSYSAACHTCGAVNQAIAPEGDTLPASPHFAAFLPPNSKLPMPMM